MGARDSTDRGDRGRSVAAAVTAGAGRPGRGRRNDPEDRGLPDGMALEALAVTHRYDDARQRAAWVHELRDGDLEDGDVGSWNHPFVADACAVELGERSGSWSSRQWRRQVAGIVAFLGREASLAEYPAFVAACASLAAARSDEDAEAWLRTMLVLAAICAAPGALGQAKGDVLTAVLSLLVIGDRTQGRTSSPLTPMLASSLGLPVDGKQLAKQIWCWPWRVFAVGAGPGIFSAEERRVLVALVTTGDIGPLLGSTTLWPLVEGVRLRNGWNIERHASGGMAWVDDGDVDLSDPDNDNPNSIATQAAVWQPGRLRTLVLDPNIRQRVPASETAVRVDGTTWTCEAWNSAGRRASITVDLAELGPLLWRVRFPPRGKVEVTQSKPAPSGVEVSAMPAQSDERGPW